MNRTLLLGTLAALGGLAVVFVPGLGAGLPLTYGTVLLVGGIALAAGLGLVRRRMATGRETADLPAVEGLADHPVPGDEFDADLAAISPRRNRENDAARAEIRGRLEAAALAVLAREGHPREVGRDMLDSGEWTDDRLAAAFFAVEAVDAGDESFGERLRSSVGGSYSFDAQAKRAAYAIAERAGVGDESVAADAETGDADDGADPDGADSDGVGDVRGTDDGDGTTSDAGVATSGGAADD